MLRTSIIYENRKRRVMINFAAKCANAESLRGGK